jgi:hypothetical protein
MQRAPIGNDPPDKDHYQITRLPDYQIDQKISSNSFSALTV